MKKRIVLFVVVIALIAVTLAGLSLLHRNTQTNTSFETVAVRKDTILATVNASGSLMPREQVSLGFSSGGILAELSVKVGQKVVVGQELARLDTRQLALGVAQAEATLKINEARLAQTKAGTQPADLMAAEAAVASAEAQYQSAKKRLGLSSDQMSIAETDLKRAELALKDAQAAYDLVAWRPEIGMLPQSAALQRARLDYERALANFNLQVAAIDDTSFKSAAAQLAQAKAQLEKLRKAPTPEDLAIAEAQVAQAQASLEQAKLRLADAILTTPFSGTVLAVNAQVGELVSMAAPVIVLADLDSYHVEASIDETDIGQVALDQDAMITLDAFPDVELPGKVTLVEPLGTVVQGVVSYGVEIEVLSHDVAIRPNMTGVVDIIVAKKEGVLVVPNRAIKRDSRGKYYVDVLSANGTEQRFITTGVSNELMTEVISGLRIGEEVVVSAPRSNVLQQFTSSPFGSRGLSR